MNKKLYVTYIWILNISVICLLFYLPYYIFEGRLFLGGDDTRFYYSYPNEVLKNFAFFSWNNITSLPLYIPNHHLVPFLLVSSLLSNIITSKIYLFYFLFSLLLVIGFIYFQKFIRLLIGKEYGISIVTALLYILAPITVVSHLSHFLTPVWLITLVPIISYYYVNYIKHGRPLDILKAVIWAIFLSLAYFAIPWILGIILPLLCALIVFRIFIGNPFKNILKRSIIFSLFLLVSQLFWLMPFVMSLMYRSETDLGAQVISKTLVDTFSPTVLATATGNIINPLLTMYHREIAFEYNWQLKGVFIKYFDPLLIFSTIFVLVLFMGITRYKKVLKKDQEKLFIFFFIAFIAALYFFTVNIGFLMNVFLLMGVIPGFSILRNFIDKCSLGYIFMYAVFLALCLNVIKKTSKFYVWVICIFTLVVSINIVPIKEIINGPIWTTTDMYQTVNLPDEYVQFIDDTSDIVSTSSNILNVPQNSAAYVVISEKNGVNVYLGTSPFKFLTGINDMSGSYPTATAKVIRNAVISKDYKKLLKTLSTFNIGYMVVTKNIPPQMKNSYIFDREYVAHQDNNFITALSEKKLISSKNGNYELHKLKVSPNIMTSNAKITYKKINSVKYSLTLRNIKNESKLEFFETFHPGWKLYVGNERNKNTFFDNISDIVLLFTPTYFDRSHTALKPYGSSWIVDHEIIKNSSDKKDKSHNVVFTLYFLPQAYFYVGTILTITLLGVGFLLLIKQKNEK